MLSTEDYLDGEDRPLLHAEETRKFTKYPQQHSETAVVKGVAYNLGNWPSHLLTVFLTACLIITSLASLVFVIIVFCLPVTTDGRWRYIQNSDDKRSLNVYFLKHEHCAWSTEEYCYVESTARMHPELNVYIITLLKDGRIEEHSSEIVEPLESDNKLASKLSDVLRNMYKSQIKNHTSDKPNQKDFTRKLVDGNRNIQNIDVTVAKFFNGSPLSQNVKYLNGDTLELAAKAYLLWTTPGISLHPSNYCNLDQIEQYFCNNTKGKCVPDKLASIELKNGLQATEIPCQAFIGFLIQEISKIQLNDREYTLNEALDKFCSRSSYCPEVRILNLKPKCTVDVRNCPTVHSTETQLGPSAPWFHSNATKNI